MNHTLEQAVDDLGTKLLNALITLIVTVTGGFTVALVQYIRQTTKQAEEFAAANLAKLSLHQQVAESLKNPLLSSSLSGSNRSEEKKRSPDAASE